ncbi:hypothetical protein CKCBHOJB_03333 [Thauera sp. GDN1]|nr:hypothetical protein CKCBHOJB_03333 [Thauera sp. GDN1]
MEEIYPCRLMIRTKKKRIAYSARTRAHFTQSREETVVRV